MNRYIMIRRLRGPLFLLLVGVNALLNEAHLLSWGHSWPLYLILAGVLSLAERAAYHEEVSGMPPASMPWSGAPAQQPQTPPQQPETALVPTRDHEIGG